MSRTSNTYVNGESDGGVVPTKYPNNGGRPLAADMEGRPSIEENTEQTTGPRTQRRISVSSGLPGVREVARRERRTRFSALLHHVDTALLRESYYALKRAAAPGVDGITWGSYETDLERRLLDLESRVH